MTLFSFGPLADLPDGVRNAGAQSIVSPELSSRFYYDGAPHMGHFSDIFRYRMMKTGLAWVDMDVLMMSDDKIFDKPAIVPLEDDRTINGAILYIENVPILRHLIDETMKSMDRTLRWGETGPLLLTRILFEQMNPSGFTDMAVFYPIPHYDIYKVLLPEFRDECAEACRDAITIHLFNNAIVRMGYWKDMAPPIGSFLHEKLGEGDLLRYFDETYPVQVMRNMLDNFRLRMSGQALGIKSIVREFVPSLMRTYRH